MTNLTEKVDRRAVIKGGLAGGLAAAIGLAATNTTEAQTSCANPFDPSTISSFLSTQFTALNRELASQFDFSNFTYVAPTGVIFAAVPLKVPVIDPSKTSFSAYISRLLVSPVLDHGIYIGSNMTLTDGQKLPQGAYFVYFGVEKVAFRKDTIQDFVSITDFELHPANDYFPPPHLSASLEVCHDGSGAASTTTLHVECNTKTNTYRVYLTR